MIDGISESLFAILPRFVCQSVLGDITAININIAHIHNGSDN